MGHIVIQDYMIQELGLSGYKLLAFALIDTCTQLGDGCWHGGNARLAMRIGSTTRTAINAVNELVEMGYITKTKIVRNDSLYTALQTVNFGDVKKLHDGEETSLGEGKNFTRRGEIISPNNKDNNKYINNNNSLLRKPTVEEIVAYCQERGNTVDAQLFFDFYESKGWKVGRTPMKDWKATVRTWEKREAQATPTPTPSPSPKKEGWFEHNLRVQDKMFGTNLHEEYYGKGNRKN